MDDDIAELFDRRVRHDPLDLCSEVREPRLDIVLPHLQIHGSDAEDRIFERIGWRLRAGVLAGSKVRSADDERADRSLSLAFDQVRDEVVPLPLANHIISHHPFEGTLDRVNLNSKLWFSRGEGALASAPLPFLGINPP